MGITILSDSHSEKDFPTTNKDQISMLWQMEEKHFWYLERNKFIFSYLKGLSLPKNAKILEIGCGSAAVMKYLKQKGFHISGVDTSSLLLTKATKRCPNSHLFQGLSCELDESHNKQYDALCYFDILEHLEKPEDIIKKDLRLLKENGFIIATVPASMSLWSHIDKLSGHKKRYEYGELSLIFQNLGLLESKESAFMSLLFPFIKYHRKKATKVTQEINDFEILRENARLPSKIQNLFFQIILSFERLFLFPQKKLSPSSLIASAKLIQKL